MHSSGPGGGGVMIVYIRENKTFHVFDYREKAPIAASKEFYKGRYNSTLRGMTQSVSSQRASLHASAF